MKQTKITRSLSLLLAFMLIAAAGMLGACNAPYTPASAEIVAEKTVGEGQTTFTLSIINGENKATRYTVKTDKTILGDALVENGLVEGVEGPYGLYITSAGGIRAEGTAWFAVYIGEEQAPTGVDGITLTAGGSYALVYHATYE